MTINQDTAVLLKNLGVDVQNNAGNAIGRALNDIAQGRASQPLDQTISNAILNSQQENPYVVNYVNYAADIVDGHAPKFKFLFKVSFTEFITGLKKQLNFRNGDTNAANNDRYDFSYYVTAADRPRVSYNHQLVNFYNFRTQVLTNMDLQSISMTFIDDNSNSAQQFFVDYLNATSGQGSGSAGIERGFRDASSTFSYLNGYSVGGKITLEQIFGNGRMSNRYHFINPRIETLELDSMDMSDGTSLSQMHITFNYDALSCETINLTSDGTINAWGKNDLLKADEKLSELNAYSTTPGKNFVAKSVNQKGENGVINAFANAMSNGLKGISSVATNTLSYINTSPKSIIGDQGNINMTGATRASSSSALSSVAASGNVPESLKNTVATESSGIVNSQGDTLDRSMSDTVAALSSNPFA